MIILESSAEYDFWSNVLNKYQQVQSDSCPLRLYYHPLAEVPDVVRKIQYRISEALQNDVLIIPYDPLTWNGVQFAKTCLPFQHFLFR